jgi:uncharacterized membrane protein
MFNLEFNIMTSSILYTFYPLTEQLVIIGKSVIFRTLGCKETLYLVLLQYRIRKDEQL